MNYNEQKSMSTHQLYRYFYNNGITDEQSKDLLVILLYRLAEVEAQLKHLLK